MDKIAVLIPCYNEAKTVEKVVTDFRRVLPEATIYVYNNNSSDGTAELAARAGAVVRHEYQQGKGKIPCQAGCQPKSEVLSSGKSPDHGPLRRQKLEGKADAGD